MCRLDAFRMVESEPKLRSDIEGLTPELTGHASRAAKKATQPQSACWIEIVEWRVPVERIVRATQLDRVMRAYRPPTNLTVIMRQKPAAVARVPNLDLARKIVRGGRARPKRVMRPTTTSGRPVN